jgi:hypothetical protein
MNQWEIEGRDHADHPAGQTPGQTDWAWSRGKHPSQIKPETAERPSTKPRELTRQKPAIVGDEADSSKARASKIHTVSVAEEPAAGGACGRLRRIAPEGSGQHFISVPGSHRLQHPTKSSFPTAGACGARSRQAMISSARRCSKTPRSASVDLLHQRKVRCSRRLLRQPSFGQALPQVLGVRGAAVMKRLEE